MVLLHALRVGGEFTHPQLRRGTQRRRIGLDEDALVRDRRGELDAQVSLARYEMVRAERKIRP